MPPLVEVTDLFLCFSEHVTTVSFNFVGAERRVVSVTSNVRCDSVYDGWSPFVTTSTDVAAMCVSEYFFLAVGKVSSILYSTSANCKTNSPAWLPAYQRQSFRQEHLWFGRRRHKSRRDARLFRGAGLEGCRQTGRGVLSCREWFEVGSDLGCVKL